jgi:putative transposase
MEEKKNNIDWKAMQELALKQFREGKSLTGKGGAFAPLLKQFIEAALEAEIESHLSDTERNNGNRRNGKSTKIVKSTDGEFELNTPRDRQSSFNPEIVKKRETILAESLQSRIIGLYGLGMSYRDIQGHIKEMYDTEISIDTLSTITDKVIPSIKEWQSRPLDSVYPFVWLDAMHYKVKEEGRIVSRAVYNVLALNMEGKKDLLGIYVSESEGANFWLQVLTDLQNRGVKDLLIASIDNLKGFAEAIESIFPNTEIQVCIIHQIRNSVKYIASKDQKPFMKDLKEVYKAVNKATAEEKLIELELKWGKKYPVVLDSWNRNWDRLSTFFKYSEGIRRIIYTTNTIEGFHRQVRKVTKTKGAFTNDMALIKLIYLALKNISKKWTQPVQNWSLVISQLSIIFGNRVQLELN